MIAYKTQLLIVLHFFTAFFVENLKQIIIGHNRYMIYFLVLFIHILGRFESVK